jgi:hypothetical protein
MIEKFAEKFKGSSMVKLGCGEIDFVPQYSQTFAGLYESSSQAP